jgi:hypothetical protein
VAAFINNDTAKAASLVANIQKLADTYKAKSLKTFVVFGGGPELKNPIQKLAADKKVNIPLTFLPEGTGASDFQEFKINPEAQNTVLVYRRGRVLANFVNVDDTSFAGVQKAAEQMLGD